MIVKSASVAGRQTLPSAYSLLLVELKRSVHYQGDWLLKFAVSVSWRSLTYHLDVAKDTSDYPNKSLALLEKCLQSWKDFIFDQRPNPGIYEQHLILFDTIKATENIYNLPPNINRFLIRGLHLNLALSAGIPAFIFTKMGRMGLFGFINVNILADGLAQGFT
jgi:hypothetical protein